LEQLDLLVLLDLLVILEQLDLLVLLDLLDQLGLI
jgi:hypothetical protein